MHKLPPEVIDCTNNRVYLHKSNIKLPQIRKTFHQNTFMNVASATFKKYHYN